MKLLPADWRLRALILTAVTLLVCAFLVSEIDLAGVMVLLGQVQWHWLLLALASFLLGHVFRYGRYLLVWGWQPGLASASVAGLHGCASYLLPLRLGELVLPALARRLGEQSFLTALGGLIWIRLFDVVVVLWLAALALMMLEPGSMLVVQAATVLGMEPHRLSGVPALWLLGLVAFGLCMTGWWMLGRFQRLDTPGARSRFVLLSLLVWAAVLIMNFGIAASLDLRLSFPLLVWLVVGTTFAYALPVQGLAGLGVHQIIWYLALVSQDMAQEPALEFTVASHVLVVACVLVLGGLGLLAGLLSNLQVNKDQYPN